MVFANELRCLYTSTPLCLPVYSFLILYISFSVLLNICLFVCLLVTPFYLCFCPLFLSWTPQMYISVFVSVSLFPSCYLFLLYLYVSLTLHLCFFLYLCICLSVCPSLYFSLSLCISLFIYLAFCVCILCLSICLSFTLSVRQYAYDTVPRAQCYKTFYVQNLRMLMISEIVCLCQPLKPTLIFLGKAVSLPYIGAYERCFTQLGSNLTRKYYTGLENPTRTKFFS